MAHYGIPYRGNKSRVADEIIELLPAGNRLVDLFGGGGAITHCAMLANKWSCFLFNDVNRLNTQLFVDAIGGKFKGECRTITRDEFNALKDTDGYVKYIWSFGNNGRDYLWSKNIEDIKCQACRMLQAESVKERRLEYMKFVELLKCGTDIHLERLKSLESLERLQALERLEALGRLEALERPEALERLEVSNISYLDYKFSEGDVVYCDPPYENKNNDSKKYYDMDFDSTGFYSWVKTREHRVFFSSYEISDNSFYALPIKSVQATYSATGKNKHVVEYLYSNEPF